MLSIIETEYRGDGCQGLLVNSARPLL